MAEKPILTTRSQDSCFIVEIAGRRISEGPVVEAIQSQLADLIEPDPKRKILIDFQ